MRPILDDSKYNPYVVDSDWITQAEIQKFFGGISAPTFYNWKRQGKFGEVVGVMKSPSGGRGLNCYSRAYIIERFMPDALPDTREGHAPAVHPLLNPHILPATTVEVMVPSYLFYGYDHETQTWSFLPFEIFWDDYTDESPYYDGLPSGFFGPAEKSDIPSIALNNDLWDDSDLVLCPSFVSGSMVV